MFKLNEQRIDKISERKIQKEKSHHAWTDV